MPSKASHNVISFSSRHLSHSYSLLPIYHILASTSTQRVRSHENIVLPPSIPNQVTYLQTKLGVVLEQLHAENPESKSVMKFRDQVLHIAVALDRLADSLSHAYGDPPTSQFFFFFLEGKQGFYRIPKPNNNTSKVDAGVSGNNNTEDEDGSMGQRVFIARDLQNYTSPKPNRESRKNFLGAESVYLSIGLSCIGVASNIEQFMSYKIFEICPDDWLMAQKLIVGSCEPVPRRRCFSRSPPRYNTSLPINCSLWTPPSESNIMWTQYKCKDYSCLVSNQTIGRRGFFKCSDCFDLSKRSWETPFDEKISAEYAVDEILGMKPGEIRIGLDFSPTTGTFAEIMRDRNVTIASATLNLGAPYSEVIAFRGLLPLYISVGSRLPFFDNTLDIIHPTPSWMGGLGQRSCSMSCLIGTVSSGQKISGWTVSFAERKT